MQNAVRSWIPLCRRCAPALRWHILLQRGNRRRLSSFRSRGEDVETWKVVCGSAGSIDVDLYNSSALASATGPLIIYLPPTGSHVHTSHSSIPSHLFNPSAALAQINYRWNIPPSPSPSTASTPPTPRLLSSHPSFTTHPFPTPLHDTLHAYTYILHSLLPRFSVSSPSSTTTALSPYSSSSSLSRVTRRPILLYGSYLGATLATSLALTESFASKQLPTRIFGLISKNGIYDWTDIATSPPPSEPSSGAAEIWDTATLYALKKTLFSSPASTFDPFASPTLFFRTSGLSIPKAWPETSLDPVTPPPSPSSDSCEDIFHPTPDPSLSTGPTLFAAEEARNGGIYGGDMHLQPTRVANLKYPPKDSGLKIPRSLFLYSPAASSLASNPSEKSRKGGLKGPGEGEKTSMESQAQDLARLMRRSVLLHELKDRELWDEDLDPNREAEERVQVSSLPHSTSNVEEEGRIVREWINDTLDT